MKGEILSEDWNTPYVLKFHKCRRVGDIQHRNSTWLALQKHSEIDSSSPPPGLTADSSPWDTSGAIWNFSDLILVLRLHKKATPQPPPETLSRSLAWVFLCFCNCDKLIASSPRHVFAYFPSESIRGKEHSLLLTLFYTIGCLRNYIVSIYVFL